MVYTPISIKNENRYSNNYQLEKEQLTKLCNSQILQLCNLKLIFAF